MARSIVRAEIEFGPRKIVAIGYSRYVALPKVWLRHVGAEAHGELLVRMNRRGELIVSRPASKDLAEEKGEGDSP